MLNFIEYTDLKNLEDLQHGSNLEDKPVRNRRESWMVTTLLGLLQERPFNLSIYMD